MDKKEILEMLIGMDDIVYREMQLTALLEGKDLPNILESLKNMEQLERIETLYEIMDEVEIDLDCKIIESIITEFVDELVALRKANNINRTAKKNNSDSVSARNTSIKAVELFKLINNN